MVYPFVAWDPDQSIWVDVSSISDWDNLHEIFESQHKKKTRKKSYERITRNPGTYLESVQGSCVGVYIVQHAGGSSYKESEGLACRWIKLQEIRERGQASLRLMHKGAPSMHHIVRDE